MLLIDMSGLVFSTILNYHAKTKEQADMSLLRHLVINAVKSYKKKLREFCPKDSDIVLCFDSRHYWRKDVFPLYKGHRKKARDASTFDWNAFFPLYDQLKTELREYFPVKCIEVHGAEADDLMAILAMRYGKHEKVCIASSDHDMIQIQQNIAPEVKQYSFHHRKFLTPKNAAYSLFEHIVKGDAGDGVPNILSDDDTLMDASKRQKPISAAKVEKWNAAGGVYDPEDFCTDVTMLERFRRNRTLVDLRRIPEELADNIVAEFESYKPPSGRMFGYLTANRLKNILNEGGF